MAVPLTGTASLTLPAKSQLTAQNKTPDELFFHKIITGGRHLEVVFLSYSDWTLIEVIMTWTIRVQTTLTHPV